MSDAHCGEAGGPGITIISEHEDEPGNAR